VSTSVHLVARIALPAMSSLVLLVSGAQAQSVETSNGCLGPGADPCVRVGRCAIQGSTWGQRVTIDRADTFDTMGWAGLCDMVHVALVQGECSPPGGDRDVTAYLSATSDAVIDSITGPLRCEAATTDVPWSGAGGTGLTVFPMPMSATATLRYRAPSSVRVRLDIVSVEGRVVRPLWQGPSSGDAAELRWDGRDAAGRRVPPGVYFARLSTDRESTVRRVLLVR